MLRRHVGVRCHPSGLHQFRTARLVVSIGRLSDALAGHRLSLDDDAQRWLGWAEEDRRLEPPSELGHVDLRTVIAAASYTRIHFAGFDPALGRLVGSLTLTWSGAAFEIGGAVLREVRGQAYGTELMTAACHLAHQHFGLADLRAGCEVTNIASARWLTRSGFVPVSGAAQHTLPNGRVIDSLWWVHSDPHAKRTCKYAVAKPATWKRYASEIWTDPTPLRTCGPSTLGS